MPPSTSSRNVSASGIPPNSPPFETQEPRDFAPPNSSPARGSRRGFSLSQEIAKTFQDPARQAFYAAISYAVGGVLSMRAEYQRHGIEDTSGLIVFALIVIGLPALLMVWRRGYVSAGILCLYSGANTVMSALILFSGGPGIFFWAILFHLFFFSIFAKAFVHLWKTRRAAKPY